jgi:hypothetical protein
LPHGFERERLFRSAYVIDRILRLFPDAVVFAALEWHDGRRLASFPLANRRLVGFAYVRVGRLRL